MIARSAVQEAVWELVRRRLPTAVPSGADLVPLGSPGLGLDSIALAEVLLDCAEHFGVPVPTGLLAEGGSLTIDKLVDYVTEVTAG
jgi:Phosphopantetheine attachment site